MAENISVLTNEKDRLQRFSMSDETSDDLMLLGFSVQLKPTYLAQLEFMKANFEE
jgi:hypothetical protein